MPNLRKFSVKNLQKQKDVLCFINLQKQGIYELILLEGLVISYILRL